MSRRTNVTDVTNRTSDMPLFPANSSFSSFNVSMVLISLGCFMVILLIYEHVGRKYSVTYRPSYIIDSFAKFLRAIFEDIGWLIAKISSFYTYIDLHEFLTTLNDLFHPIGRVICSPAYVVVGYIKEAASYIDKTVLVYFGTATLSILLAYFGYPYATRAACWSYLRLAKYINLSP